MNLAGIRRISDSTRAVALIGVMSVLLLLSGCALLGLDSWGDDGQITPPEWLHAGWRAQTSRHVIDVDADHVRMLTPSRTTTAGVFIDFGYLSTLEGVEVRDVVREDQYEIIVKDDEGRYTFQFTRKGNDEMIYGAGGALEYFDRTNPSVSLPSDGLTASGDGSVTGYSLAATADVFVAGMCNGGYVMTFERRSGRWEFVSQIDRPVGATDRFGEYVALTDDFLFVGTHVYKRSAAGVWEYKQQISPPSGASFSVSVDSDGEFLVYGGTSSAVNPDTGQYSSAGYLYGLGSEGLWEFHSEIRTTGRASSDSRVGVGIRSGVLAIGGDDGEPGFVEIFEYSVGGDAWNSVAKFEEPESSLYGFGRVVDVADDLVVAATNHGNNERAAAIYRRDTGTGIWSADIVITGRANLGDSVAIEGDICVVGNPTLSDGSVLEYRYDGATWTHTTTHIPPTYVSPRLGTSVAIAGDTIVSGAPYYDLPDTYTDGAVFLFD